MKQVYKELRKPEVREQFKSLIIDTVDIASDLCQKYICTQLGIETMGEGGWSVNSWAKYKKEFEEMFRSLTQMGYAVFFISHEKEQNVKLPDGREYQKMIPSLQSSALLIVENMADIYGYAHPKADQDGRKKVVLTLRDDSDTIKCGCRFKYIKNEIDFTYESLVDALVEAIDKEANDHSNKFVTDEHESFVQPAVYEFDPLKTECDNLINQYMAADKNYYNDRIAQVITRYLGKDKKLRDVTRDQAELLYLIVSDLKEIEPPSQG